MLIKGPSHSQSGMLIKGPSHSQSGMLIKGPSHSQSGMLIKEPSHFQSLPLAQSSRIQPYHVVLGTGFKRIRIRLFIVPVQVYKEKTIYCPCTSLQRKDLHNCISCSLHVTGMCDDVARRYRCNSLLLPESVMMLPDTHSLLLPECVMLPVCCKSVR